ncbi:MAG: aldo/keto reductase [Methanobrevibacter sp.]|nr:aldo/keto reductase [Methanobrevibacter sp.]MBQ6628265.1 aldo/keto reductase [Methanobrevibacter sp.]MBR0369092.1 aldo/keto reductase [Methanobrevibacter sp.]
MEYKTLSNGVEIPQLGFGVFQIPPKETKDVVKKAIEVGYRHFDTAQAYFNEAEIGEAIKESGIAREELFITTKVWVSSYGYEETKKAFQESLDKLQTDYVDLYLLHQCMGDVYSTWRAVEDLYKEGKIKAIGVCNFTQGRFTDLALHAEIPPMVNQIEVNPFYQQEGTVEFHKEFDAVVEAWGPLAEGKDDIFNNPILSEIGSKYGKSVAQVILRWLIQRDIVVFPKSTKESRMI